MEHFFNVRYFFLETFDLLKDFSYKILDRQKIRIEKNTTEVINK